MRKWLMILVLSGPALLPAAAGIVDKALKSPPGFQITLFASQLPGVRVLRFTSKGDVIVSIPDKGQVLLLSRDGDNASAAVASRILLDGLNGPHGLDLHDGMLYVAEEDAVGRIALNEASGAVEGAYRRIITGLPQGVGHSTRTIRVGPDRKIYVTAGSSCNVCIEEDPRRAAMLRYDLDGGNGEVYAHGLRNAVGFDWRPADGALYATDNGRDWLGDDLPPCELNRIENGAHYGWPYAYGRNIPDPEFGAGARAVEVLAAAKPPVFEFRAHNAPLGIVFVRDKGAPQPLRGAALVALHGSWNRSVKDGYKVVSLHWLPDGQIVQRDFLWGFLDNGRVSGRPADVAQGPDGAFYVSDDYAGNIYRVAWNGN
jgi:glucose/arabinose dehydrogenase